MTGRWAKTAFDNDMGRRVFLKAAGTAAILAAAGTAGCMAGKTGTVPAPVAPSGTPSQAVVAGTSKLVVASDQDPAKVVDRALDAYGGLSGIVKSGDKIVIKANYSFARTEDRAAANHPLVLSRLAGRCEEAGATEVTVIDHTIDSGPLCLDRSGIKAALGSAAVCINSASDFEERSVPGVKLKSALIARKLRDADVFINAPVIKSHGSTMVTASMKNLMGLVWDRGAFHSNDLDRCIVDIAGLLKPDLIVADAYRVLKTGGPAGQGEIILPHEVIVGNDPVAVDAYAAGLIGLSPGQVDHIRLAHESGLGEIDPEKAGLTRV